MQRIGRQIVWRLLVSALLLAAMAGVVWAQGGYTLGRYSADQSGAHSTGGGYTLVASIGQADAGGMSGGGFELAGGFLTGAPIVVEEEPELHLYLPRLGH